MQKTFTFTTGLLLTAVWFTSCSDTGSDPKTEDEKVIYAFGHLMGSRLQTLNMSSQEISVALQGVRDGIEKREPKVDLNQQRMQIGKLMRDRSRVAAKKFKEEGEAYIKKFVESEGGTRTESGLAYKLMLKGEGKKPSATDTVKVHYHGTLMDGTVFDSSVERKQPADFPLNRVIRGWTEGLQLVGKGGKIKLVIPSDLAYGDRGSPPNIPGGATLIFEIEVLDVVNTPPAAASKKKASGKRGKNAKRAKKKS